MARIFVNIDNDIYRSTTNSAKPANLGLGKSQPVPDSLKADIKYNEIFFTSEVLREKRRKLQVILDNFTGPGFFVDGSINPEVITEYLKSFEIAAERVSSNPALYNTAQLALAGTAIATGVSSALALKASAVFGNALIRTAFIANANFVSIGAGSLAKFILGAVGRIFAVVGVLMFAISIYKKRKQEGREDDAADWTFSDKDFPNITNFAKIETPNQRAISRLYDSRKEVDILFNKNQVDTNSSIIRLTKEALADALYTEALVPGAKSVTSDVHPRNTNGTYENWEFRQIDGTNENEQTYLLCLLNILEYINLIDDILSLKNNQLSRSPDTEFANITVPFKITLLTAQVSLFDAMSNSAVKVINDITNNFYDETRDFKTLLNFGNDIQYVAQAWRFSPQTRDTSSIQLKLLTPLDTSIQEYDTAFISSELAKTVIDSNLEFTPPDPVDNTLYLRPYNSAQIRYENNKKFITDVNLTSMGLSTGSSGTIVNGKYSYENVTFRRWLTNDFNASELNIDFTDYNNFVFYGSAYKRINTFSEKLQKIETLNNEITASVLVNNAGAAIKSLEKENIIRNFDPYERFLYYATQSIAYSASAFYTNSGTEYHATGSWPKYADGTIYPVSSASVWLTTQGLIAQRYDDNNSNYLIKQLPDHITEDEESRDFLTLVSMVGHVMDNIKVYIDQFPYIYSVNPDPFKNLTMDQVYEVAQSFGLNLPNVYSLVNLQSFNASIIGESGSRASVAETWKRFLHNAVYLSKTKGSRTSINALLNTYGIGQSLVQVKETNYPVQGNYIQSEEVSYGLLFTGSAPTSYVKLPFASASVQTSTLQVRFKPTKRQETSIITGNDIWYICVYTGSLNNAPAEKLEKLGYLRVQSPFGSVTSSYFPVFSDDYTHIMLRSQSADLTIIQTDGDQILFEQTINTGFLSSSWNSTSHIYVGGSGSLKTPQVDLIVDEVHTWNQQITNEDFTFLAYDPGSYYSTNYTGSYDGLYIHLAFSQPLSSITQSATNESPFKSPLIIGTLPTNGFTTSSYSRVLRNIKQYTPIVGATIYSNKKVNVVPPPVFKSEFIDGNNTKYLNVKQSIKRNEEKKYTSAQNVISIGLSPTDFTNQNILRSMGVVDVNNLIGSPRYVDNNNSYYSNLHDLDETYKQYYKKIVNPNEYIRFFKDLVESISEMANTIVPARAKIYDGIIIESPILKRQRQALYRPIKVSGTQTKLFNNFVSGSGSIGVGAYDFGSGLLDPVPQTLADTLILDSGSLRITDEVRIKSTTPLNKMPASRVAKQYVNRFDTSSFVYSSIMDENSSYASLEAQGIDASPRVDFIKNPYARSLFYGIPASGSVGPRLLSEENTIPPIYDIPPRSDLNDVGTTSYFHKENGVYPYKVVTQYKENYIVKLDTKVDDPLNRLYSKITLLRSGSIVNPPERDEATIGTRLYIAGAYSTGVLTVPNIFSIFGVLGQPGLRLRLYKTDTARIADISRPFLTQPSVSANVLFDALLDGVTEVFPYTLVQTENARVYYSLNNDTGADITSEVSIQYFGYEPGNLTPLGYLPRHYKFTRENLTALKRRNYMGSKGTDTVPPSGCPWDPCPPFRNNTSGESSLYSDSTGLVVQG